MKILSNRRIILEDFPEEQRKWLPKLLSPLNQFLESTYAALNKNLTLEDNIRGKKFVFDIGAGTTTIEAKWDAPERPSLVLLGQVTTEAGDATALVIGIIWTYAAGSVSITLTGLDAGLGHKVNIIGIV